MAGKTLKDLKDRVDIVKSTQLEMRLNNTLIGKYFKSVDNYLLNQLKGSGHISIPTMQYFMDMEPNYKGELEELYVEKMKDYEGYEQVDVATMVAQAALFDSLCFVYDRNKDTYSLATMNFELLYDLDVEYDMLKQVLTKNKQGIVKAYRIDVEYNNSDREFTFKAVNARDFDIDERKPDDSEDKRFFLVPYMFSTRFMKIIEALLNNKKTIRVHQALNGVEKVRFISKDYNLLAQVCDTPESVKGLEAKFFPLKGFFYAPVVGAPSTTAMVTNINMFDVYMVKNASSEDFKKYGVHKPVNPIRDMIGESLVANKLITLKYTDEGDFAYMISNLPCRNKYLASDVDTIDSTSITRYLHSLTNKSLEQVYNVVGVKDELNRRMGIFEGNGRAMTADEIANIEDTLKNNVCRVVLQKKDCKLSSVMCTNNKSVLSRIYGENYVKYYEGFSTKFYIFLNWYKIESGEGILTSESIGGELDYLGLPNANEDIKTVLSYLKEDGSGLDDEVEVENLKGYFADKIGISLRKSTAQSKTTGTSVLSRSLTAYLDEEGKPVEYYKNIDKSKIISGIIL